MAKRFPLVVDTENNNRIIELPVTDCLDLTGSDICSVENITVTGTITLPTGPVSSFSGYYSDLIDPDPIPTKLSDLGIVDGEYNTFLKADGNGNYSFSPVITSYLNLTDVPDLPTSILDLGIVDGDFNQFLRTDGEGNFSFADITNLNLGNLNIDGNEISNTQPNQNIVLQPNGAGYVLIDSVTSLIIPKGTSLQRIPNEKGAIRYNIDYNFFEGFNGTGWASLGGVRSLDGDTYILPETTPGAGDDTLLFVTGNSVRITLTNDEVTFANNLTVNIDTLNVENLNLVDQLKLDGNTIIGDSETDTLTINSKINGNFVPTHNNTFNVGSPELKWQDLHVDNRAFINDYELPLADGNKNDTLKSNGEGELFFTHSDTWGGNRVYVSQEYGNDNNDGITAPVKTVKKAVQLASNLVFEPTNKDEEVEYQATNLVKQKLNIANETIAYIAETYPSFGIDSIKCERDLRFIIEAIIYDQAYGTNYNSVTAGLSYYRSTAINYLATQKAQTLDALGELKNELANIEIWSTALTDINSNLDHIIDILNYGENAANPKNYPNPSVLLTPAAVEAKNRILANKTFIQDEVTTWLTVNFPNASPDLTACKRDIGLILDGMVFDLLYGGNYATINTTRAYFLDAVSILPAGQESDTVAAYTYMSNILEQILLGNLVTPTNGNNTLQDLSGNNASLTEVSKAKYLLSILIKVIDDNSLANIERIIPPKLQGVDSRRVFAIDLIKKEQESITTNLINYINTQNGFYNSIKCHRDVQELIDAVLYDLRFGGNSRTVNAALSYYDANNNLYITGQLTETVAAITFAKNLSLTFLNGTVATDFANNMDLIISIINNPATAPAKVYGTFKTKQITVMVATGDYTEDNPIVIPENVSIIGDNLRRSIIRPKNANKDLFRVRNGVYLAGLVFRDHVDTNGVPDYTFRYAVSFDQPNDSSVSRAGYAGLPVTKPIISTSPYIQNVSIISFLGGGGAEIDGNLVDVPNIPPNPIEAENPVDLTDGIPEQGKSMVANAFTILSFGGNAWRVINDAYAQIVSCFVIFCENGCLTQNGGYLSVTNSASNFGLFSLRSTGYSPNSFLYNRGIVYRQYGFEGSQTLGILGMQSPALEHYVIRFKEQLDLTDITDNYLYNDANNLQITQDWVPTTSNVTGNIINFGANHQFVTGDYIQYASNGDAEIVGLLNELKYYASVIDPTSVQLFHDENFIKPVRNLDASVCTTTHSFTKGFETIYIEEIIESHTDYQDWYLPTDINGTPVQFQVAIGSVFLCQTSSSQPINVAVADWDDDNKILTVSLESFTDGEITYKNFGDIGTIITPGFIHNAPNANIVVLNVNNRADLYTSQCKITTTENTNIINIDNTLAKRAYLHRPSVTNSSAHTWEFAGSGIDYNALPQNGGSTIEFFEQVSTLPGRVYSSGTNELGDFKVGNFVTAFNRNGNITFSNKVNVGELDSLSFSLGSGIVVNTISTSTELGEDEFEGPSNSRLITQLAARTFLENKLGNFFEKQVSTNPIPGAVIQLNSSGTINSELIPPTGTFTAYTVESYLGRLTIHTTIPTTDLRAGDIVIEEYDEVELDINDVVTLQQGEILTQRDQNGTILATGIVKDTTTANSVKLIEPLIGTFEYGITTHTLTGSVAGLLVNRYVSQVTGPVEVRENYFITTSRYSQFLILEPTQSYDFTNTIGNQTLIKGAVSNAVATVEEFREGVLTSVDVINDLPSGGGYTPGTYRNVELIYDAQQTGLGGGATADITVSINGDITSVDLIQGGERFLVGEVLTVPTDQIQVTIPDANFIPKPGAGDTFTIHVFTIENRLYVNLDLGTGLQFNSSEVNLDFIVDDTNDSYTIQLDALPTTIGFAGDGNSIDQVNNYIIFAAPHNFTNGDYVRYDKNGNANVPLGLVDGDTYYVKIIDTTTIQLYTEYSLQGQNVVSIDSAPGGTANHLFVIDNHNTDIDRFYLPNHGLQLGDALQITGNDPPDSIENNAFVFIGSVTPNCFSLHLTRGAALSSINGLTIATIDNTTTGTGIFTLRKQTVIVIGDANTSGQNINNWSTLSTTTIDASNIISGIIDPARLAIGAANNTTFLRGDNTWAVVATGITNTISDDPINLAGSFTNDGQKNVYYGEIDISIEKTGYLNPTPITQEATLGVAKFAAEYFVVTDGLVETRSSLDSGQIDALTLSGANASFYRNPINLNRTVPIEKGGTNLSTYTAGDLLFAATNLPTGNAFTSAISKLAIGTPDQILVVNQSNLPEWSSTLSITSAIIGDIQVGISGSNIIESINNTDLTFQSSTGETVIDQNVTITGNLTVDGTSVIINTTELSVEDINITVAKNAASQLESDGAGITVNTGNPATDATITYDGINDEWNLNKNLDVGSFVFRSTAPVGFEGNATSADKWSTARTITFEDDGSYATAVTGSFTIDGSGDVSNVALDLVAEQVQDIVGTMFSSGLQNGIGVIYDDFSGTINLDVNDPTITLQGAITGTVTMNDLGDVTITTEISEGAVNLGTAVSGGFVESMSTGNGLSLITNPAIPVTEAKNARQYKIISLGDTNWASFDANGDNSPYNVNDIFVMANAPGTGTGTVELQGDQETVYVVSHADTSTQASVSNTGNSVIQSITLDDFGHITAITTSTISTTTTLDEATTAGNTTTNSITVGGITSNSSELNLKNVGLVLSDGAAITNIKFTAINASSVEKLYANIKSIVVDTSAGLETGKLEFMCRENDTEYVQFFAAQDSLQPGRDSAIDLGASTNKWANLYATTISGTTGNFTDISCTNSGSFLTGNVTNNFTVGGITTLNGNLQVGNAASDTASFTAHINSNFIPYAATDPAGYITSHNLGSSTRKWNTVYAATFAGTATSAQYADLAEMYSADTNYPPGTVMMFGGENEVTAAVGLGTTKVIGVVSTDPAYLMNSKLEGGTAIALKGRVPCLVVGKVDKGDMLIASDIAGVATVTKEFIGGAIIGKAIESSNDEDIKMIEVAVGI